MLVECSLRAGRARITTSNQTGGGAEIGGALACNLARGAHIPVVRFKILGWQAAIFEADYEKPCRRGGCRHVPDRMPEAIASITHAARRYLAGKTRRACLSEYRYDHHHRSTNWRGRQEVDTSADAA